MKNLYVIRSNLATRFIIAVIFLLLNIGLSYGAPYPDPAADDFIHRHCKTKIGNLPLGKSTGQYKTQDGTPVYEYRKNYPKRDPYYSPEDVDIDVIYASILGQEGIVVVFPTSEEFYHCSTK
jgi:hypothetical protein